MKMKKMKLLKKMALIVLVFSVFLGSMDHLSTMLYANDEINEIQQGNNEGIQAEEKETPKLDEEIQEKGEEVVEPEKPQTDVETEDKVENYLTTKPQNQEVKSSAIVISDTFKEDAKTFAFQLGVNVEANSENNKLVIKLPQYVKLSSDIKTDDNIKEVTVIGDSKDVNGITITLSLINSETNILHVSKDIGIDQSEYMLYANAKSYQINVELTSNTVSGVTESKTYQPQLIHPDINLLLNDEKPQNYNSGYGIFALVEDTYKLKVSLPFDYNPASGKNKLVLDQAMFDYFKLTGGRQLASDGTFTINLEESMYDSQKKELTIPLPIDVDLSKTPGIFTKRYVFKFKGKMIFESGKESLFSYKLGNVRVGFESNSGTSDYISMIQKNAMMDNRYIGYDYRFYYDGYFGNNGYIGDDATPIERSLNMRESSKLTLRSVKLEYSFQIPENLEWYGESNYYNSSTRTITIDSNSKYAPRFSLNNDKFLIGSIPLREKFSITNTEAVKSSYKITDRTLKIGNEIITETSPLTITYGKGSSFIGKHAYTDEYQWVGDYGRILSGKTGIRSIEYLSLNGDAKKGFRAPAHIIEKDYREGKGIDIAGKNYKEADIFKINNITIYKIASKQKFSYKTNNSEWIEVEITGKKEIKIPYGEQLVAYKLEIGAYEVSNLASNKILDFGADVNAISLGDGIESVLLEGENNSDVTINFSNLVPESEIRIPGTTWNIYEYKNMYYNYTLGNVSYYNTIGSSMSKFDGYIYPNSEFTMNTNGNENGFPYRKGIVFKPGYDFMKFQIKGIKVDDSFSWERIDEVIYETNKNTNRRTVNDVDSIQLYGDEYFTYLEFIFYDTFQVPQLEFRFFNPMDKAPAIDSNLGNFVPFVIDSSYSGSPVSGVMSYKKNGVIDWFAKTQNQASIESKYESNFSTINAGETITKKILLQNTELLLPGASSGDIKNPTFYIPIPSEFEFVNIEAKGHSLQGKKPKIREIYIKNQHYVKVEFHGTPNSDTGYLGRLYGDYFDIQLKAKDFARAGKKTENMQVYVDIQETINYQNEQNKGKKQDTVWPEDIIYQGNVKYLSPYKISQIFDESINKNVKVYSLKENTPITYTILQSNTFKSGASVKLEKSQKETTSLEVRSGEIFHANINLYNGLTEELRDFTMYIPVAREGKDNGNGGTWEWSAQLLEAGLDISGNLAITYSTNENPTKNMLEGKADPADMYLVDVTDKSKVTMVKIHASSLKKGDMFKLESKIKNAENKLSSGNKRIEVYGEYAYFLGNANTVTKGTTNTVSVDLIDTSIKGKAFLDVNENGLFDADDRTLSNVGMKLYDKNHTLKKETITNASGIYEFQVMNLDQGDYVKVDILDEHMLTNPKVNGGLVYDMSYFDKNSGIALPDLTNAEYLNVGFISTPKIKLSPTDYIVKVGKTVSITNQGTNLPTLKYSSNDYSIASAMGNGNVFGNKIGETQVEVYYTTKSGIRISETANIKVISNDAPLITAPETLVMNVGDRWDPLDLTIVKGLGLSDDHDVVDVSDLTVEESIPVGSRFLFFFNTKNTGKLTTPGTYKVKYSYRDNDGNRSEKEMKVKVNGQPWIETQNNIILDQSNIDDYPLYHRANESLNEFKDVKAYYMEASDTIGDAAVKTEILPNDTSTGTFILKDKQDSAGNPVIGSPVTAGKYQGTYYVKTPSQAESEASIELTRLLYVREKIHMEANSISYPSENNENNFKSWDEFYQKYGKEIQLRATVNTPLKDGTVTEIDLLNINNSITVLDPKSNQVIDFSSIDFALAENETSKEIELRLQVTDPGLNWDDQTAYGEKTEFKDIVITVQKTIGNAPSIHTNDIERITSDEVRDVNSNNPNKNLISQEAMEEAENENRTPLYDRLMNDVTFTDDDGTVVEKSIVSIERISSNPNAPKKTSYDPKNEKELKEMFTTLGTYVITYQAIDDKNNKTIAKRKVFVAGETIFVEKIGNTTSPDIPFREKLDFFQENTIYYPSGVFAYHMDADEITKHETSVNNVGSVDIQKLGTYEVSFETGHHFTNYPYGGVREKDVVKRKALVHGQVEFYGAMRMKEDYFINATVDLRAVKARYLKASEIVGGQGTTVSIPVKNSISNADTWSVVAPKRYDVEFEVKIEGLSIDYTKSISKEYNFYGYPSIKSGDSVRIPINASNLETEKIIHDQLTANVVGPDGKINIKDKVQYDLSNLNDSNDPYVIAQVSYTVSNSQHISTTKTAEEKIKIVRVAAPVLEANDYVYHVGDKVDLIADTGVKVVYDQPVDNKSVQVETQMPIHNGTATTAGTYKVTFKYMDDIGQEATKEVLIKVHGLPVIYGVQDLEKRIGDNMSIWDQIEVAWLKAPDQEGAAVSETFRYETAGSINAILELRNTINEITKQPVDFTTLNTPGYYSGEFYAKTPSGGETVEKHTLLLHGKPTLEVNNINITKNDKEPNDFLNEYKEKLKIQSKVIHANKNSASNEVDLGAQVTVNQDDLNKVKWGTIGSYPVRLSVTDTKSTGSANDTVTKTIMVNILEFINEGDMATISTPDRHRVSNDPIGMSNVGEQDIKTYLTEQPIVKFPNNSTNQMKNKELKSFVKVSGTTTVPVDINNNVELKNALNEVGIYEAEIEFTDGHNNKQKVKQLWKIAGENEFGIGDSDATFVPLKDVYEIRQRNNAYEYDGIRVRHKDPDGQYHYMMIKQNPEVNVDVVSKHDLRISAIHHYEFYEDDTKLPRDEDIHEFTLLVQGRIEIQGIQDIETRVNASVDGLAGITATFERIDTTGTKVKENARLCAETIDTASIGRKAIKITAEDKATTANDGIVEEYRIVYVAGLPNIQNNEYFSVSKDTSEMDVLQGLGARVTYVDWDGTTKNVNPSDISINLSKVDTSKPGNKYEIEITVNYSDNGQTKRMEKIAHVYVLNDPSAVVDIPSGIYLKNMDATHAGEKVDVQLHSNVDTDPASVPKVKITTDKEIDLTYRNDVYKAQIYDLNDILYDGIGPILELKHGEKESGSFYIKTLRDKEKAVGNYKGILNFKFEYEGK